MSEGHFSNTAEHRYMRRRLTSVNSRSIYLLVFVGALFIVIFAAQQVRAQGFFENLGRSIDETGQNYKQGSEDGKSAGVNHESSECPSSDTAYCVGWNSGYGRGERAAEDVDQVRGNNGGGTTEDDGEFVQDEDNNNDDD